MSLTKDIEQVYDSLTANKNYDGPIYTFDLDKTYLATEFKQFSKLVKIPFEKAHNKRNIPGTAALVRELKNNPDSLLLFISGSPKKMRNVITEKLHLDKVYFDGLLLKDFGEAIRKFKWKNLVDKIGYKLAALLYGRIVFPENSYEILFGDDSEYDATIYSLYADIIEKRFEDFEVLTILKQWNVNRQEFDLIHSYLERLKNIQRKNKFEVRKIFIHLESKTHPNDHMSLSDKVIPTYNYFQTTVILYNEGYITKRGLFRVINELRRKYRFNLMQFTSSVQDLFSRDILEKKESRNLLDIISKGNPLALPLKWLTEMKAEAGKLTDTFINAPKMLKGKHIQLLNIFKDREKKNKKLNTNDLLKRYIEYTPKRNVRA